jgi:hypothetical protein
MIDGRDHRMGYAVAYGVSTLLRLPSIQHWDGCTAVEGTGH